MASNIKGITIEIGGNTTKLDKALGESKKVTNGLQSELKQIDKLLQFDPTNTELLAQKQKALTAAVNETSSKLDILKEAEAQVAAQFEAGEIGEEQLRAFQREIISTKNTLSQYQTALASTTGESNNVKSASEQLKSTISDQESELKDLKDRYVDVVLEQGKGSEEAKNLASQIDTLSDELNDNASKLDSAKKSADDLDNTLDDLEGSSKNAGEGFTVMKGALASLVADGITKAASAISDFAKESIQTGIDFESSMAEVQAISGATGKDFELLEQTAKEYGATTVFSASEAAQALKYMSLAGWDANQSANALGGVLDLASASGMDLAQASDMVTDYLSAFGMEAEKSSYFADMLAFAQANSNTSAEQLGEAYKNCAASMNAAGQDVETTTALLAQMANQGFKGSEAGTALTAMMRDMSAKMFDLKDATQTATLEQNGFKAATGSLNDMIGQNVIQIGKTLVAVSDANGNYRDMTDILKDVETATDGMGEAQKASALMSTFTADSTKGLNLLLNAGVTSAEEFEEALRGSTGTAEDMGEIMNDTAAGDLKEMQSALEDLQISLFDELQPTIRDIVQTITEEVIPVVKENVIPAIKDFIEYVSTHGSEIISMIVGIGAAFAVWQVASMIMGVVQAIKAFKLANEGATLAQIIFNAVLNANPLVLIITLVAGLVAALITFIATNENARKKIVEIWNKVKETFSKVIGSIVSFFTETIPNAFKSVINWIKKNWTTILTFLINPFAGLFKYFYENNTKFREFVDNAISQIKQLPGKIWEWLKKTIIKIALFVVEMHEKGKEAAKNLFEAIVNGLKSLPEKIVEIGKNLVKGLWNGINNAKDWVLEKVKGFGKSIIKGVKSIFGIHSPSKVFEKEIGENLAKGLVKGIENESKNVTKAAETMCNNIIKSVKNTKANAKKSASELSEIFVKEAKTRVKQLQDSNQISEADSVKYWKTILSHTKKGTAAYREAYTELVKAQKTLDSTMIKEAEERLKKLEDNNKISLAGEVGYWEEIRKHLTKGTDAYEEATKKIAAAKKTLNENIKSLDEQFATDSQAIKDQLIKDIKELTDAYEKAVEDRKNAITSQIGLFDAFSASETIDKGTLTSNLKSQVDAYKEWDETLDNLEAREGIPIDLIETLRNMGVASLGTLKELNSMSDEEIKEYIALYEEKQSIAEERALKENEALKAETEKNIDNLIDTANKDLAALNETYIENLKEIGVSTRAKSVTIGKDIVAGIISGVISEGNTLTKTIKELAESAVLTATSALDIHSPSRVFRDLVGKNIVAGITEGITENAENATKAVKGLSGDLIREANNLNGISLDRQIEATFTGGLNGVTLSDLAATIKTYGDKLIQASNKSIVLDSGVLVGETINSIDAGLSRTYSLRERRV